MSDTAEQPTSKESQDAAGYDVSSQEPPPYSYQGQQPPPYSAAPAIYPPPKAETTRSDQSTSGYESFRDINPEASSDAAPTIASSSFDDRAVRRGFVRKVRTNRMMCFIRI